jgi:hypothetical protein
MSSVNSTKADKAIAITIGADPEFFLSRNGEIISAHDIVPGTKDKPHPLKNGIAIQADGTAVEFNIPPAKTADEFCNSIQTALDEIRKAVPKEFKFEFKPSVKFPQSYFDTLPKNATELGCSPDFAASDGGRRKPIIDPKLAGNIRAAGGHIHVGWGENLNVRDGGHLFDCVILVNSLNWYFKTFEKRWDKDNVRQTMYGNRGAFRPKSYGVEYRGLSNKWLEYPKLWPWIFNNTKTLFDININGPIYKPIFDSNLGYTPKYIDNWFKQTHPQIKPYPEI